MTDTWFRDALERSAPEGPQPPSALDVFHCARRSHRRRMSARAVGGLAATAVVAIAVVSIVPHSSLRPANISASSVPPLTGASVPILGEPGINEAVPPDVAQALQSTKLDPSSLVLYVQQSASMARTLLPDDHVLVNRKAVVSRGSIVVFNVTGTGFPAMPQGATGGEDPYLAKRVLAVGGDTISCPPLASDPSTCSGVLVNGQKIDESAYLFEDQGTFTAPDQQAFPTRKIAAGQFFVLGDHRDDSSDSRPNGPIPRSSIVGIAIAVDSPADHARVFGAGETPTPLSTESPTTVPSTGPPPTGYPTANPSSGCPCQAGPTTGPTQVPQTSPPT